MHYGKHLVEIILILDQCFRCCCKIFLFLVAILFSGAILKEGIMRNIWGRAVVPEMTFQLLDSGHRNCLYNFG